MALPEAPLERLLRAECGSARVAAAAVAAFTDGVAAFARELARETAACATSPDGLIRAEDVIAARRRLTSR